MWLLASAASWGMFGCGVLMLIFILLKRSRRYLAKTNREKPHASRRDRNTSTPLLDAPPEILRWQVEMHETARDLKAELDTKLGLLQALVRAANDESARLEAAIRRAESLGITRGTEPLEVIEQMADGCELNLDSLPLPASPEELGNSEVMREQILRLARAGHSAREIADETGVSRGEVEMLLSLGR